MVVMGVCLGLRFSPLVMIFCERSKRKLEVDSGQPVKNIKNKYHKSNIQLGRGARQVAAPGRERVISQDLSG
jgi:hypothetical protein